MPITPPVVLLIDGDEGTREAHSRFLARAGCRVVTAADARTGMTVARSETPRVIVLDLGLPDTDAWQFARELRMDHATRDIPIIAFTAEGLPEARQRAAGAGIDGYVVKPCFPEELVTAVRKYLG